MLHAIDACAHTNRWRAQSGPVALFCAGLMACVLLAPPLAAGPLVAVAASAAAVAGARVPARLFFRTLLVPAGFLAAGALALCISLDLAHARIGLSAEGAATALATGLRSIGAVTVTLCFACTVPTAQWIGLLRRARMPEPVLDLMLLVYRTLFVLDAELRAIRRAQDNRLGFRTARLAWRNTARAAAALFLRSLQRAERLERGLAARGYTGALPVLTPPSAATRGTYALAGAVPALVTVAAVAIGHVR